MKLILAVLLCFPAFNSNALIRKSPTPQLHSVLDSPQKAKPDTEDDGWLKRLTAQPKQQDVRLMRYRASRQYSRNWGIGFTIAGGLVLVAGGLFWMVINDETERQRAAMGRSHTADLYFGAMVIGILGLALVAMGVPTWLKNM